MKVCSGESLRHNQLPNRLGLPRDVCADSLIDQFISEESDNLIEICGRGTLPELYPDAVLIPRLEKQKTSVGKHVASTKQCFLRVQGCVDPVPNDIAGCTVGFG